MHGQGIGGTPQHPKFMEFDQFFEESSGIPCDTIFNRILCIMALFFLIIMAFYKNIFSKNLEILYLLNQKIKIWCVNSKPNPKLPAISTFKWTKIKKNFP